MTKDAPAFDLNSILAEAVRLAEEHGCEVRVSKAGAISVRPLFEDGEVGQVSASTLRVRRFRAKRKALHVTDVTHETPCNAETPSPSLPPSPPSPAPPSSTPTHAPPPTHTLRAHIHARPSLEQAFAMAQDMMIPREIAQLWWDTREVDGWVKSDGGGGSNIVGVGAERSDLRRFAVREQNRAAEKTARQSSKPRNPAYDPKTAVLPGQDPSAF